MPGSPDHVPVEAVSVSPVSAVPPIAGSAVLAGATTVHACVVVVGVDVVVVVVSVVVGAAGVCGASVVTGAAVELSEDGDDAGGGVDGCGSGVVVVGDATASPSPSSVVADDIDGGVNEGAAGSATGVPTESDTTGTFA